jgi:hypothetical protein
VSFSPDDIAELGKHFARSDSAQSGPITLAANSKITLTDSQNTGNINRLLTMKSTYDVDRPAISWLDETGLHVGCFHYHTRLNDALGGTVLKQFEIKTIADQAGANPTDQRTRFTVGTQAQRVKIGFVYTDTVEIYQGENPLTVGEGAVASFGLDFRAVAQDTFTSSNFKIANISAQVDATDNAFLFIDCNAPYSSGGSLYPGNKGVQIVFFRNTNISSGSNPKISIKKGDGTNTDAVVLTAKTGQLQLLLATATAGALQFGNDSVATLYRSAASTIKTDGNIVTVGAIGTKVKAGTPVDGDLTTPVDGMIVADSTGNKLWVRLGGTWKGVTVA